MMTESNRKFFTWGIVLTVLLVYGILFLITQDLKNVSPLGMLKIIPTTVTVALLLWFVFSKWGWKWKIFHTWLVATPDLSGRWEGTLHYVWNGQEGDRSTNVKILQNFNHVTVILSTSESDSRSVSASFDIDEKRGIYALYYTYVNEPNITIQDRSAIHYGTTRLRYDPDNPSVLKGEYWTSRDTKGTMELHKC